MKKRPFRPEIFAEKEARRLDRSATEWLRRHDTLTKFQRQRKKWQAAKEREQARKNPALIRDRRGALGLL